MYRQRQKLEGRKFGNLRVLEYAGYYNHNSTYITRCERELAPGIQCGEIEKRTKGSILKQSKKNPKSCTMCMHAMRAEELRKS
jgi:hypothetical protein